MVTAIEREMRVIVQENRPIVKEVFSRDEAVKLFKETKQVEKANLIASLKLPNVSIYRCGGYCDYLYGAMIGSTGHLGKFALDILSPASSCARQTSRAAAACRNPCRSQSSRRS